MESLFYCESFEALFVSQRWIHNLLFQVRFDGSGFSVLGFSRGNVTGA